jgi:RND superfamily putative drug exporter
MHRQIAGKLTSPVTKWIVAGAWIVIFIVASGFAQKLTDVQDNEASSWLPGSAESTKALDELKPFQDPNDIPTIIVYHRANGLTQDDLGAITAQLPDISAMKGVSVDAARR